MSDYTPITESLPSTEEFEAHIRRLHAGGWHPDSTPGRNANDEVTRWIAALRAEWKAEQGEVEWEYGFRLNQTGTADRIIPDSPKGLYPSERGRRIRRRKAGPWEPVNENGDET